ncbi:hypothetical protein [Kocuria sabuli]|uniref:hypothetical protein n=1 Tax=Kocuria sabuli TaxID=3071448 RepID=UPI0034D692AE
MDGDGIGTTPVGLVADDGRTGCRTARGTELLRRVLDEHVVVRIDHLPGGRPCRCSRAARGTPQRL